MTRHGSLLLMSALLLLYPIHAKSQPVAPGTYVRIATRDFAPALLRGTVDSWRSDTLTVRTQAGSRGSVAVPVAAVKSIERFRGSHGHFLMGLGIGFAVGAGVGTLIGSGAARNDTEWGNLDIAAGFVLGGAAGLLGGGVIGLSIRSERWEPVSLPQARYEVTPDRVFEARLSTRL